MHVKHRRPATGLVLALLGLLAACGAEGTDDPARPGVEAVEEFAWLSDDIARGAQPKSGESFRQLAAAGIRTIISVDGARPDIENARKHGLRYVHIPFGYDTVPPDQQLALAKTVRELPGPFFVHCHHGKHRGPAGAVLAQMALGGMTPPEAVAELRRAGTAAKYTGLYACARDHRSPDEAETRAHGFDFPETAPVPALAEAMATIDRRWDGIKLVRQAGWRQPPDHPDVSPAHEALQLRELFTELVRAEKTADRPPEYHGWMKQSRDASVRLEDALRSDPSDTDAAETAFETLRSTCASCHKAHRNRKVSRAASR
jgi:protein tyrosine phosphatase (PTP) superfamily phosphohydrolase (DUF442 family)